MAPVFELIQELLDATARTIFVAIVESRVAASSLGLGGNHPKQRAEAVHVMGLAGRQGKSGRATVAIAAGVELRREAAARSAKALLSEVEGPLGRFSPFFMPTAQ